MSVRTRPGPLAAAALRDAVPILLSVAPFALVIGATAATAGIPPLPGAAVTAALFAGGAQYAALTLVAGGAGALTVLSTVALLNARLLIYAAALEPRFRDQPRWFRWLGPALLIDQTYLLVAARDAELGDLAAFRRYWLVAGGSLMVVWVALVGLGGVVGPMLPAAVPLEASAVVVMVGLLAPRLTAPRPLTVALSALIVAFATARLPGGLGLVAGIAAGLVVGVLLDGDRR
jgi:predicted branched-subunit amino acid permease